MQKPVAKELFTSRILAWYAECGRHDLPWQKTDAWYPRLVSEVMLQQTQVVTVLPKYEMFMNTFPTPDSFAAAPEDSVMAVWAGLGYYSRARNLHKAVQTVLQEYGNRCPPNAAAWEKLPGIGPSTAGALAAFCQGERAVMSDGNAQRVLARVFEIPGSSSQSAFQKTIRTLAAELLPASELMGAYTQALMDMGALQCTRKPECTGCPVADICGAHLSGREADYPAKKPKVARPVRYGAVTFLFSGRDVWLRKKKEQGVWRGLWIPAVSITDQPVAFNDIVNASGLGHVPLRGVRMLEPLTHDFTHFRLEMVAVAAELSEGSELTGYKRISASDTLGYGLPAPITILLRRAVTAMGLSAGDQDD